MFKKELTVAIILLFVGACVVSGFSIDQNNGSKTGRNWLYVGGSGPGNYTTIQSAISAASAGDTIFVYNKTYYEHVNVDKSISLIGENKLTTIINGSGADQAIEIMASSDDISIKGFTCTNANIGIYLNYYCDEITIDDNILKNNLDDGIMINEFTSLNEISNNSIMNNGGEGIYIKGSTDNVVSNNAVNNNSVNGVYIFFNSDNNLIYGNTISNNSGYGIQVSSSDYNYISGNTVLGNYLDGVRVGYSVYNNILGCVVSSNIGHGIYIDSSDYNSLFENTITSNSGYGLYMKLSLNNSISSNTIDQNSISGIYLAGGCDNNIILNNLIEGHTDFGILNYYYSNNNQITENTIIDNGCGIQIQDHCNNNEVSTNTITSCDLGLKIITSCTSNLIYNNLFDNTQNCVDDWTGNIWNISKTSQTNIIGGPYLGGNSFSDYTGTDVDGDGLGDTPYDVPGTASANDYLPLTQWDNTPPEITDITATPQTQTHDDYVKIGCNVTDNYIVEQVCVIITYPDSTNYNFTMEPGYFLNQNYSQVGTYSFYIWAVDNNGNQGTSSVYTFEITNLVPNTPEKPSGKGLGKVNTEYTYSSVTTDPEDDEVYYWFDWGDGTDSGWVGPYASGDEGSAKHTWTAKGNYDIRVKAKDNLGAESNWSEPLSVKMPKDKTFDDTLFRFFENHPLLYKILQLLFKRLQV